MRGLCIYFLTLHAFVQMVIAQDIGQLSQTAPVTLGGSLGVALGTYSASGIPPRSRSFQYLFSGSPVLTVYGVSFPFSAIISDQHRSFRQPFNQFGVSPYYKWVTLHAGWRNLSYSPFTLAGHAFLGAGIDLTPGKLRFGAMYGRLNKAIEDDPALTGPMGHLPAYRRTGYSVKLGYGTQETFIDLIFLQGKDHENSLHAPVTSAWITPAENSVAGISSRIKIAKGLSFETDVAASVYTRDRTDTSSAFTDSLPRLITAMGGMMRLNNSSQLLTAARAALRYQRPMYGVTMEYRRVEPDYQSMGAYYMETDVEQYTLAPVLRLHKNKLRIGGSMGLQYDDLKREKMVRSQKVIGSATLSYQEVKYGVDVRYTNYGISQRAGLLPLADDRRVARTNRNVHLTGRYQLKSTQMAVHNLVAAVALQSLTDLNKVSAAHTETSMLTGNLLYQFSYMPYQLGGSVGMSYTSATMAALGTEFYGPSLTVDKQFMNNVLQLSTSWSWQSQRQNGAGAGNIVNGQATVTYKAYANGQVRAGLTYLQSAASILVPQAFHEFRTQLGYVHLF